MRQLVADFPGQEAAVYTCGCCGCAVKIAAENGRFITSHPLPQQASDYSRQHIPAARHRQGRIGKRQQGAAAVRCSYNSISPFEQDNTAPFGRLTTSQFDSLNLFKF
jgi:hypothetical protein